MTRLPDQNARDRILSDLDSNLLVEAAAGTGKTTSLVGRMVALLREGTCAVRSIAAVTFTRKAAAELRDRFRLALERAAGEETGERRERLEEAASRVHEAFIGTIHAFCARLLRERPVEAEVSLDFEEIEEEEDAELRRQAWRAYADKLYATDAPILADLEETGLQPAQLEDAFVRFCEYPDVDDWPRPEPDLDDMFAHKPALMAYLARLGSLVPDFPTQRGTDELMDRLEAIWKMSHAADLDTAPGLGRIFERFESSKKATLKWWDDKDTAKDEEERYASFREDHALPALQVWRAYRYPRIIEMLYEAQDRYKAMRHNAGRLNFADLLLKAAEMLRKARHVRDYFHARYTHILVDEFQDTDPIQAEVMMLLAADNPGCADWREARPRPGALFVVGDPKQSIYRFRRADISTYNQVRDIIQAAGGAVLRLSANFRTSPALIDWVNAACAPLFSDRDPAASPAYVPLDAGREDGIYGRYHGAMRLDLSKDIGNRDDVVPHEAQRIAQAIKAAIDTGDGVTRAAPRTGPGDKPAARAEDFLIVTYATKDLERYAGALEALDIPHEVTGGGTLNRSPELRALQQWARAVLEPDDAVALAALLRGPNAGCPDTCLYAFRHAGGEFDYRRPLPPDFEDNHRWILDDVRQRLRRYADWFRTLPAAAALEKMADDLGLYAQAAAARSAPLRTGALGKIIELVREATGESPAAYHVLETLERLASGEAQHDAVSAGGDSEGVVRVMNLHKVKGLEAPVVFLACPFGHREPAADVVVERGGERTLGYLEVYEPLGDWGRKPLARPMNWEEVARREVEFLEAERARLLYVAATRAGSCLVVCNPEKQSSNPWRHLSNCVKEAAELPATAQAPPASHKPSPPAPPPARGDVAARWALLTQPSYRLEEARKVALAEAAPAPMGGGGEHGAAIGKLVHYLLETALGRPGLNIEDEARRGNNALGTDLPADAVADCAGLAHSVLDSEPWRRALRAERRLAEPFFAAPLSPGDKTPRGVVRGRIDLAFGEPDGWVLVDYKTDRVTHENVDEYETHYAPQLLLYAEAWRAATGEDVAEAGLYFVRPGIYRPIDLPATGEQGWLF